MNELLIQRITSTYHIDRGSWRAKSNNNSKTPHEIFSSIGAILLKEGSMDLIPELPLVVPYLEEELRKDAAARAAAEAQVAQAAAAVEQPAATPTQFISDTLSARGIVCADSGRTMYRDLGNGQKANMSPDDVLTILNTDLWDFNRYRPRADKLKEGDIKNRFLFQLLNGTHKSQATMGSELCHDSSKLSILDSWLVGLHTELKIIEPIAVWKMLVKHMMWLVKRNIYSKKVKNDIWLQIMGKQGTGKSHVARHVLFQPINNFYIETELSKIEDIDREVAKFTSNFVVNFDEVAIGNTNDPQYKVSKKMLNNLKSILTRDVITVRAYHTQKQENRRKTFTAFSSANTHLYDVIFDDTGMRRFFEFNSAQPKDNQFNHGVIAALGEQALDAWKAIDEEREEGYWVKDSEEGRFVFAAQENYFPTNSTVAMWTREVNVVAGDITLDEAYTDYQHYCRLSGNTFVANKQSFSSDMRHICKDLIDEKNFLTISYTES